MPQSLNPVAPALHRFQASAGTGCQVLPIRELPALPGVFRRRQCIPQRCEKNVSDGFLRWVFHAKPPSRHGVDFPLSSAEDNIARRSEISSYNYMNYSGFKNVVKIEPHPSSGMPIRRHKRLSAAFGPLPSIPLYGGEKRRRAKRLYAPVRAPQGHRSVSDKGTGLKLRFDPDFDPDLDFRGRKAGPNVHSGSKASPCIHSLCPLSANSMVKRCFRGEKSGINTSVSRTESGHDIQTPGKGVPSRSGAGRGRRGMECEAEVACYRVTIRTGRSGFATWKQWMPAFRSSRTCRPSFRRQVMSISGAFSFIARSTAAPHRCREM